MKTTKIYGLWDDGIVLDNHMQKSTFIGYDENGREQFDSLRTEIGELVYRLKYKQDISSLNKIVNLVKPIIEKWNLKEKVDMVIPVPASNKKRSVQPVEKIANEIAKQLNKKCDNELLIKNSGLLAKDGNDIKGTIIQNKKIEIASNILIIDDLYSTGNTLNEVCRVLKKDDNVKKIYCLVLTKTKRGG